MKSIVLTLIDQSVYDSEPEPDSTKVTIQLKCTPWMAIAIAKNLLSRAIDTSEDTDEVFTYVGVGHLRIPNGLSKYLKEDKV